MVQPIDYCVVRDRTERLAAPLGPEDQVVQSMPDCSPTKWHRAHTTWFFEEFVLATAGRPPVDERHRFLFNSYYEAVGARQPRPRRGMITRPTVAEVGDYRRAVDRSMVDLLAAGDLDDAARDVVVLGLHHEEQHQELLLMDAKHLLFQNPYLPAYDATDATAPVSPTAGAAGPGTPGWIDHPGEVVGIGHADGHGSFSYDNEGPHHETLLRPFRLADRLVTCGDWLAFMDDGGYRRPELWLSDGWGTVQTEGWDAPLYWDRDGTDGPWRVFTLTGPRPFDGSEPVVHVSYYEADAFARWSGHRLPTEAEWEAVATDRWQAPTRTDQPSLHPVAAGTDGSDPLQLTGEVWQWTSSAYQPYPGFRAAAGAIGEYNGKFMVNQQVLRGGCCATPPGHSRPTYRNFYYPGTRWMFAGVRLAADV